MDFHVNPLLQMHTGNVHSLEEYQEEDDGFYDELRRQILQLTDEEDDVHEDDRYQIKIVRRIEARKQGPCNGVQQPLCYYDWPGIEEDCTATPTWMLNLWRSGNGTGVFIPQTVQSGRKNRSRRKNGRGRIYNGSKG